MNSGDCFSFSAIVSCSVRLHFISRYSMPLSCNEQPIVSCLFLCCCYSFFSSSLLSSGCSLCMRAIISCHLYILSFNSLSLSSPIHSPPNRRYRLPPDSHSFLTDCGWFVYFCLAFPLPHCNMCVRLFPSHVMMAWARERTSPWNYKPICLSSFLLRLACIFFVRSLLLLLHCFPIAYAFSPSTSYAYMRVYYYMKSTTTEETEPNNNNNSEACQLILGSFIRSTYVNNGLRGYQVMFCLNLCIMICEFFGWLQYPERASHLCTSHSHSLATANFYFVCECSISIPPYDAADCVWVCDFFSLNHIKA